MSNFKFAENLFLGKAELNRLNKFLATEGYEFNLQADSKEYGIINNSFLDPNFSYFKVSQGSGLNIKLNEGYAFNSAGLRVHYRTPNTEITPTNVGVWYWVKVAAQYNSIEDGTLSIGGANKGAMSGAGTKFTEVLRGQPDFPSKIKFLNSINYTQEYEILEVIDDNNAIVQGNFDIIENGLQYVIVGTFDAAYYPPVIEKMPLQYDDCLITLVPEIALGVKPIVNEGLEFLIARVQSTGNSIIIQDYRRDYIHRTRLEKDITTIDNNNPLIGISSVQKVQIGGQYFYDIHLDWKFNIANETQYGDTSMVAIALGSGGIYITSADFKNGDFNGWKYYYTDGDYSTIITSTKNGNSIILQLDAIKFGVPGKCVCPAIDEIEIHYTLTRPNGGIYHKDSKIFDSNADDPTLTITQDLIAFSNQVVQVQWKYKNYLRKTAYAPLNQATYYNDQAYDVNGALVDPTKTTTSNQAVLGAAIVQSFINIPRFCPIPWDVPAGTRIRDFFDETGLGIGGEFVGWAICNGVNNTQDWREVVPIGATRIDVNNAVPANGAPPLSSAATANPVDLGVLIGNPNTKLTSVDQLPPLDLDTYMEDSGHVHDQARGDAYTGGSQSAQNFVGGGQSSNPQPDAVSKNSKTGITWTSFGLSKPFSVRQTSRGVLWICRIQ